jgi:hypothetical protein
VNRRRFLGVCGVAGAGGLSAFALYDDGVAAGAPSFPRSDDGHPRLLAADRDPWSVHRETERSTSASRYGVDLTAAVDSTLFSYDPARARLAERTRGALDRPVVLAALSRVDLDSYVNLAVTVDRLAERVLPAVEAQLADADVRDIDHERTALAEDLRGVQRTYDLSGAMAMPAFETDVAGGVARVAGFDLDVAGVLALWKADVDTVYLLGGVYPADAVTRTATATVEGPDGESRTVDREVTVGFEPERYREAVLALLERPA